MSLRQPNFEHEQPKKDKNDDDAFGCNDMREEEIKCRTGNVRSKYMHVSLNHLS